MSGDRSRCALGSLGAIAQGAILPGVGRTGNSSRCALGSLGAIAQGAILPGEVRT
jgi:hypothetical protein